MKQNKVFLFVLLCSTLLMACTKEEFKSQKVESSLATRSSTSHPVPYSPLVLNEVEEIKKTVDCDVWKYFENFKTVIYATSVQTSSDVFSFIPSAKEGKGNKIVEELYELEIRDGDGNPMPFAGMKAEQKEVFIDLYLAAEAKVLNEKIAQVPALKNYIEEENRATGATIESNGLTPLILGIIDPELLAKIKRIEYSDFARTNDAKRQYLKEREDENPDVGGSGSDPSDPNTSFTLEKVRKEWAMQSRPGNFVLRLSKHNEPWIFATIVDWDLNVGHAGIIDNFIYADTDLHTNSTIESFKGDGVQCHSIADWKTAHYLMGIQKVEYYFSWKHLSIRRECHPVNSIPLRDWANKYIGVEYARNVKFPIAKLVAPHYFTCTTLVWWCSKKAYGINLSRWLSTIVTPADLLIDENSYIIASIE